MKKDKRNVVTVEKSKPGSSVKKDLPIKNAMTDNTKNAASQLPGLNQENTSRDDLFPSDGDNLTN